MESRNSRFKRLANSRVNNALKQIELIGNLSNKSMYEYSESEIKAIFQELDNALKVSKSRFVVKRNSRFKI
jgi:hypothetical protein